MINTKQEEIPFVNIILCSSNSTIPIGKVTTDRNGLFTINHLVQGNSLTFSSIGYKTKIW